MVTALSQVVKARRIKQTVLAKHLGISKAAVSMQLKIGVRTLRTAQRYAEVLECHPLLLMDGMGIPTLIRRAKGGSKSSASAVK